MGTRGGLCGRLRLRRRDTPTITIYSTSTCRKTRGNMENWAHGRADGAGGRGAQGERAELQPRGEGEGEERRLVSVPTEH